MRLITIALCAILLTGCGIPEAISEASRAEANAAIARANAERAAAEALADARIAEAASQTTIATINANASIANTAMAFDALPGIVLLIILAIVVGIVGYLVYGAIADNRQRRRQQDALLQMMLMDRMPRMPVNRQLAAPPQWALPAPANDEHGIVPYEATPQPIIRQRPRQPQQKIHYR